MDDLLVSGKLLHELKVTELKDELGKRSLSKSGNKLQLSNRLGEYLLANPEGEGEIEHLPEEPRKGSPPKNLVVPAGDSIVAQYLAERESLLAESLDHKRKVQAAEPRLEVVEEVVRDSKGRTVMEAAPPVVASASFPEEDIAPPSQDSSVYNSRRKGRTPEMRRSTRSSDKVAEKEEPDSGLGTKEDVHVPAVAASVATSAKSDSHGSPTRTVKSPSPRKEDLGSQPAVVDETAVSLTEPVTLVAPSQLAGVVEKEKNIDSNAKMVSRGKNVRGEAVDHTLPSAVHPAARLKSPGLLTDGAPGGTLLDGQTTLALDFSKAETRKTTDFAKSSESSGAGRESPTERRVRSTRVSPTKSPSPVKETSVKSPLVAAAAVLVNREHKQEEKLHLPRKLTDSISVEEEKLDYGEIEPDEDVSMRDDTPLSRAESPRGQKRRQSVNLNAEKGPTTLPSTDNREEVLKARSEKFGTPHAEVSKDIKEPPRKMARSGLAVSVVKEDSSQSATTSSNGQSATPPPSRNVASKMLHVRNLVRPYSLPQLKELLRKTGSIVDDPEHFWIDGIKSQCIVTYSTEEEAEITRKALFNFVWPESNPQKLVVEFMREEEFKERTSASSTPAAVVPPQEARRPLGTASSARSHIDRNAVEKLKITVASNKETGEAHRDVAIAREEKRLERRAEREKELEATHLGKGAADASKLLPNRETSAEKIQEREWDRGKASQPAFKEKEAKMEDTPTKPVGTALEILFQRTETRPQLYWKPLTDEEIKNREEEEVKNSTARDERRKQLEQDRLQRDRDESKAGFDRTRRETSRERRLGGGGSGARRDSPRRRSRSRGRDELRGNRSGGRAPFNRRNSPGPSYRRRRTPSPNKYRSARRSRSTSRGRRN